MGRSTRITLPNLYFHVLNRGNNKQLVFHDQSDYVYYTKLIKRYKDKFNFKLYHVSLMPNHIHHHMEPTKEGDLSRIMQRLPLAYAWYHNAKYQTVGHLWQGRFKSQLIDSDEYFVYCGLYVELNPVRAGLVKKPEDWKWSSYNFYAHGKCDKLIEEIIDPDPFYMRLANEPSKRQEIYRSSVETVMKEDFLKNIRHQLEGGAYGSQEFIEKVHKVYGIGMKKRRGRPRKLEDKK